MTDGDSPAHVLVVAHQTAASPALLEAVRERAVRGPCWFHLLVPLPALRGWHHESDVAAFLPRARRRFSHAHPRHARPGAGLGLVIVDSIARAHHGRAMADGRRTARRTSVHVPIRLADAKLKSRRYGDHAP